MTDKADMERAVDLATQLSLSDDWRVRVLTRAFLALKESNKRLAGEMRETRKDPPIVKEVTSGWVSPLTVSRWADQLDPEVNRG